MTAFWPFIMMAANGETALTDGRPAVVPAVVTQPRTVGYVVGDLLQQRVLLQADGHAVEPTSLPGAGRIGAWFERRRPRLEFDSGLRRWLVVDYQIVNAPQGLQNVTLPAWRLTSAGRTGPVLAIPALTLTIGPLTAATPASAAVLRPDHRPPRIPREPLVTALQASLAAAGLTGLAWLAWWRWRAHRSAQTLPFARALREMRGLASTEPRAWQSLHRAFDQTAGRVIQLATLPALFEAAPLFAVLREGIEAFFRQSSTLFFGAGPASHSISPHDLCVRLCRIERRCEP